MVVQITSKHVAEMKVRKNQFVTRSSAALRAKKVTNTIHESHVQIKHGAVRSFALKFFTENAELMPTCCTEITASCIKYILQHEHKILRLSMHYLQLLDYNFFQLLCRKSSQRITSGRKHSVAVPNRCKGDICKLISK